MKIAIGSDHAGYHLRQTVKAYLEEKGHEVLDLGTPTPERTDYPIWGAKVGQAVADGTAELGVCVCGSGVGIGIAANKVDGVRCAVVSEPYSARMARAHNNANVVSFGERVIGEDVATMILDEFLTTEFEGGRHAGRVDLLTQLDHEHSARAVEGC